MGKDLALLASGTPASLATGQVGVFKNGNTPTTSALSAGDVFRIGYKDADGQIIFTPQIEYSNITRKVSTAYSAAAQKKVYVGYNGSTGSIVAANSDVYIMNVILRDNTTALAEHPPYEKVEYTSDASATEKEIAEGILANALKNMTDVVKVNKKVMVQPGLICSASVTATNDFINDATVVQNLPTITSAATAQVHTITLSGTSGTANVAAAGGLTKLATFATNLATTAANFVTSHAAAYAAVGITLTTTSTGATDGKLVFTAAVAGTAFTAPTITNASGDLAGSVAATQANVPAFTYATSSALAVGYFLRIGSVGGGTALTSEVYKVTAISGTTGTATVTLDRPVKEASGTYAAATHDIEVIPASTAENVATNWGISLTGVAQEFKAGLLKYQVIDFEVVLNEAFGSTIKTVNTTPNKGMGTYEEIAEIESFLKYNRGESYRVTDYPVSRTLNATVGKTYDVINFDWIDTSVTTLGHGVIAYGSVMIATEDESSQTLNTSLKTVLGIS